MQLTTHIEFADEYVRTLLLLKSSAFVTEISTKREHIRKSSNVFDLISRLDRLYTRDAQGYSRIKLYNGG